MGIVARQATLNTLLAYFGIGLGFVNVVLLYPRVLAAEEFGLTRLLVSIATIAAQVAQLGAENNCRSAPSCFCIRWYSCSARWHWCST
ncbi:MAG: hypothetical protein IPJ85_00645 [Flavobacteriales bacterium]|nr:hypothetical protein [Flavobacteriales bacterium]